MPGRRSTILKLPWSSVVAERDFSIRAGLEASTVTPGSTAPVVSRTVPAIAPVDADCAETAPESMTRQANSRHATRVMCDTSPPQPEDDKSVNAEDPRKKGLAEASPFFLPSLTGRAGIRASRFGRRESPAAEATAGRSAS